MPKSNNRDEEEEEEDDEEEEEEEEEEEGGWLVGWLKENNNNNADDDDDDSDNDDDYDYDYDDYDDDDDEDKKNLEICMSRFVHANSLSSTLHVESRLLARLLARSLACLSLCETATSNVQRATGNRQQATSLAAPGERRVVSLLCRRLTMAVLYALLQLRQKRSYSLG
ncbi:hypothetical protein HZH66_000241 [Vespula vulgaris]|uniref:Uncharacterized protein n=1 Tax=Vespula vulgaris TaxID=7454 RepID=A0A834NIF6_VESVU|nr:hypothetical protein HZH66_000241 [Vespula vulgaris]